MTDAMVDGWREALGKAPPGTEPQLGRAVELAEAIGYGQRWEVQMPIGAGELGAFEAAMAEAKRSFVDQRLGWKETKDRVEAAWVSSSRYFASECERKVARKVSVRCVEFPESSWAASPGKATLADPAAAALALEWARRCVELRKLLPKARARAKALGFKEDAASIPLAELGVGVKRLAESKAEPFDAGCEFQARTAVALYVDDGIQKGFSDRKGNIRNDIAEACLFPSEKAASAFAKRHVGDCHAVEVVVGAVSYRRLNGSPGAAPDLAAVIAARERAEIEGALAKARVDDLEAELAKRVAAGAWKAAEVPLAKPRPRL